MRAWYSLSAEWYGCNALLVRMMCVWSKAFVSASPGADRAAVQAGSRSSAPANPHSSGVTGPRPRHAAVRCLMFVLAVLTSLGFSAQSLAHDVALVLARPDGVFASFAESFRNTATRQGVNVLEGGTPSRLDPAALAQVDWVVAGGVAAAEAVLSQSDEGPAVLLALSARSQYLDLRQRYPSRQISAVVLDQPAARQLALIRLLLPDTASVGVVLGPDSQAMDGEYRHQARNAGLQWESSRVSSGTELARVLERVLRSSDVLLALPDSVLSSPAAARAILLTSFKYRRPVIGFSRAYVDAGALAAVVSTPEHNGRDSADWIAARAGGQAESGVQTDEVIWPSSFEVVVNPQVARSLSLDLPDVESLRRQLALPPMEVAR